MTVVEIVAIPGLVNLDTAPELEGLAMGVITTVEEVVILTKEGEGRVFKFLLLQYTF